MTPLLGCAQHLRDLALAALGGDPVGDTASNHEPSGIAIVRKSQRRKRLEMRKAICSGYPTSPRPTHAEVAARTWGMSAARNSIAMPSYARDTHWRCPPPSPAPRRAAPRARRRCGTGRGGRARACRRRPCAANAIDVADARVAPPDVARVLVVAVLRVVEQHVGAVGEVVAADPVGRLVGEVAADRRLVVGQVRRATRPSSSIR